MLTGRDGGSRLEKETPEGREELRAKSLVGLEVILCLKISDGFVTEARMYEAEHLRNLAVNGPSSWNESTIHNRDFCPDTMDTTSRR